MRVNLKAYSPGVLSTTKNRQRVWINNLQFAIQAHLGIYIDRS